MVGPLDSQIVINQSVATEKVQEVQQRHPDLQQRHFALRLHEEQEKKQRDIRDTQKTEEALIGTREKKDENRRDRRRERGDPLQKAETALSEENWGEETGCKVDIFV
jgi:hypothetical protein